MPRPVRTQISRFRWATLFSEQGGRCAGCHQPLGEDCHVDHVDPIVRGGPDVFENLQLLHTACNLAKADMPAAEWFARCWRIYRATIRPASRHQVTLSLDVELVERLRLAAYWSRRSINALIEDGAQQAVRSIEAKPWPTLTRVPVPQTGAKGRWASLRPATEAGAVRIMARNGDLFADLS